METSITGFQTETPPTYLNNTYEITSRIGYLIGVKKEIFENESSTLQQKCYNLLNEIKSARIIRNLCILRTVLFKRYKYINHEIYYNMKNLHTLPEYVPEGLLRDLSDDGMDVIHANWQLNQYIVFVSTEIKQRIADCRELFPLWINWDYIKELFIIPKIAENKQLKAVWGYYTNHLDRYPFQMFINWKAQDDGNILLNDEKFIKILYGIHGKVFYDTNKLKDASDYTKTSIYNYIQQGENLAIVVDCENADPYKLYSMLNNLDGDNLRKVSKIILYNDIHASTAWKLFNRFVNISVEHKMISRVKENKSLVDIQLAVGTCREYYENRIDSFILISSDSDYWGLIQEMPECRFLVMVEYEKCSGAIISAMKENGITYCYLDDFCSNNLEAIQAEALLIEMRAYFSEHQISVQELIQESVYNTRATMSDKELEQFKKRYLSKMRVVVENEMIRIEI
ncbi:MAG: NYN domain-containing protein [Lachnospiraceae bacterium]|nr:NYN domain-containing protein [Lachnospiraceae bacterium]